MRGFRVILLGLVVIGLGATAAMAWLGYFGGPLFTDMPAERHAPIKRTPYAIVLLSGDIGFNMGMGRAIAARFAADGVPVVGVNTLTYMRRTRTRAEVVALITTAERRALQLGHADRVMLVGISFGADMLHVGLAELPADLRARIGKVVLIVPEDTVQFRASPGEVFDYATPTIDAMPTARRLTWVPLLCVHGIEETESLCPMLKQRNARIVALPGGHPLHRDTDMLYDTVSQFVYAH